jgi:cellulose synthase/poly-beta-1,6-N-acetylglucosamine synthase-like glycosyltransferase
MIPDQTMVLNWCPQVAVIVPIYNGEADLPDLLQCLRSQSYPSDRVEYLLVDNNSSDRTSLILENAVQEAKLQGINLKHLTETTVQSSYKARNTGIRNSNSEILAFTDADCRPQKDWLKSLVEPFIQSEIGIVVGEIEGLPGNSLLEKYSSNHQVLSQKFVLDHPFCPYGQTANLAIRKELLTRVGLFRPYLTTGGDADLCWRILRETDVKIEFVPEAIIYHRHRSNLKDFRSQWRRYGKSNRYLHELYGVDLMRELTFKEYLYRLTRWLLKEIPLSTIDFLKGQGNIVEIVKTPLDLIGFQARNLGQKESKLSSEAKEIERL